MSYFTLIQRWSMRISLLLLLALPTARAAENDELIWEALRSGEGVALIRHALAPGGGDPASFDLNDCSTQRNLSDTGRAQAKGIGDLFKAAGMDEARLFSSQWCRCMETAELMAVGEVTPQPLLNSFFQQRALGPGRLAGLQEWLAEQTVTPGEPLVLVTHQVTITGLTGVFPSSGEIVVIQHPAAADSEIKVIGTLETD
ncbi:MAG: Unknown protein [uncultured Thiotrichaceae bacterium]|uniref:Histidine phosphatase family protein n=1 Tax=uncultured Thiotrichaceae bacterium TaxID=298394 RepID=A0A6S6TDJ1_9GAMM|nr:MAG: Unknown protein [uncultured Thiotrichaceae bacterium]